MKATVIGAGLAGCEAAWQLVKRGIEVTLVEMKPQKMSPAHKSPLFAELVCSNSLRSARLQNAVGLLKEEMRILDSLIMKAADQAQVPAGGALAVDRDSFSGYITNTLRSHPLVTVVEEEITEMPEGPAIVATGPLTSDALARAIEELPGMSTLHFFDAAAPIVTADSIDMDKVYRGSRYGRGDDYLNCPMDREQYDAFVEALINAETAPVHGFEENMVFEGCMPVESMAKRGHMVLAFGPLKPVGLINPRTGREDYAVVQLRQDDASASLYNIVGFQTRLKFPEQRRIFGMIPGLENAEFARYGVMHRNTFLQSPGFLDDNYRMISRPDIFFAGQMTGVEGYVESTASGLAAGIALARQLQGKEKITFPTTTAIGALARYVSTPNGNYQPMNITFGLIDPLEKRVRKKMDRYDEISKRAIGDLRKWCAENDN
ncbi:MAG: methylenetetrahydrofolate--tRNA-(uracil(54)-C(5))-methyltransferase (FADH(2)-oxidizing) TrmFO [Clostridia bacterium]|nr:methylenetetrahydrofolate--tRNA-(uracil(54)-C(5))-methyltransferase (FADH(2)-oxidizing) TrmFO [Clostridia bacterium]